MILLKSENGEHALGETSRTWNLTSALVLFSFCFQSFTAAH